MKEPEDIAVLRLKLHELLVEHRDLDEVIERMALAPPHDDLMLRRMKKRLECMIEPDIPA